MGKTKKKFSVKNALNNATRLQAGLSHTVSKELKKQKLILVGLEGEQGDAATEFALIKGKYELDPEANSKEFKNKREVLRNLNLSIAATEEAIAIHQKTLIDTGFDEDNDLS